MMIRQRFSLFMHFLSNIFKVGRENFNVKVKIMRE